MIDIYWVGPRQSDIYDILDLFKGSITIYGDNMNNNISFCNSTNRINHNLENEPCNNFIREHLENILLKNSNARFLFYNQEHAYCYGDNIAKHSIGTNSRHLLESLSNKAKCRYLLSDIVDVVPYTTLRGRECTYDNLCKLLDKGLVVQKVISSGGDGTYHIKPENINLIEEICNDKNGTYLISPYLKDAISLNIHAVISDNKTLLSPASIQIVSESEAKILYSGADFICFQELSKGIMQQLNDITYKICDFIKKRGYRGIVGIDFILHNGSLFFMELNPRFQASTELVNRALKENKHKSLQELHLLAFENKIENECLDVPIKYSNAVYTTNNISLCRLKKILSSPEKMCVQSDGYLFDKHEYMEKNVYLCRCIFEKNICFLRNGKLAIQPNIFVEKIKPYLISDNVDSQKRNIKFALLNHGVTLTEQALELAKCKGHIREAVFDAIDITIFDTIKVNVPFSCNFNTLSPFTIDRDNDDFILLFDEYILSKVVIDFVPEQLTNKRTSHGIPFDSIINLATDRIRINPAPVCIYKINNKACQFCNLPIQNNQYDFEDIKEVIDYCLNNVTFRHFLIGGGTYSLTGGWDLIIQITKYIRSKCSKDIYLMAIPPQDLYVLEQLKNAGITEVAFNLEIFDRELASQIMPGKGKIPLSQYMKCFRYSVQLWGNSGKVRSLLIYGFDAETIFLQGIEELCKLGVEPIISIFRPLEGTVFANACPPATSDIFSIYEKCQSIAEKYSLSLGPDCPDCQNNTLSFSFT